MHQDNASMEKTSEGSQDSYDYSQPGTYFLTICLQGREPYLEMPEVRHIAEDTWKGLPQRFPTIELDEFTILSDHIHFILKLRPDHKHRPTLSTIVGVYKSLTAGKCPGK